MARVRLGPSATAATAAARSYFSRIFYFYLDFYWRSTVVLFARWLRCEWGEQRARDSIGGQFPWINRMLCGFADVMENYDVAPAKNARNEEKKVANINWTCHRCSASVKYWAGNSTNVWCVWIIRKEWRTEKKCREKFVALLCFFSLCLARGVGECVCVWLPMTCLSFVIFDSVLRPDPSEIPCRRRCNYWYRYYLWQLCVSTPQPKQHRRLQKKYINSQTFSQLLYGRCVISIAASPPNKYERRINRTFVLWTK